MSEEMNRELIKALAYGVPYKQIIDFYGLTIVEIEHFAAEHAELIIDKRRYLLSLEG
ncbi:MAG: hypothetical protein IJ740_08260 [Ruminococcus sp.]|nr:hypothetical protein [Ruminococcus sp.]